LLPLPGGGVGDPVLTSNNPELVTGAGLLYGNARPLVTRGGQPFRLEGRFGVYLHHLVDTDDGRPLFVSLLITNPNATPVRTAVRHRYSEYGYAAHWLFKCEDGRPADDWYDLGLDQVQADCMLIAPDGMLIV
jgi:hypothetical protein